MTSQYDNKMEKQANENLERDRRNYLLDRMDFAIAAMTKFPSFEAQEEVIKAADPERTGRILAFGEQLADAWPDSTFEVFLQLTFLLSDSIARAAESMNSSNAMANEVALPRNLSADHMFGTEDRASRQGFPFAEAISSLLGRNAMTLLMTPSREGPGKLQPHEFSRAGWYLLRQMRSQVKIENELQEMGRLDQRLAKDVVAAAWTLVALAGHMHEDVFITEGSLHLSAVTSGSITTSFGRGTETIMRFWPSSLLSVVRLLRDAVQSDEIQACDMMWLAAGAARVMEHSSGWCESESKTAFQLFLSHRGRDLKADLTRVVLDLDIRPDVFLDCLSLPRGLVNRHFVFRSLVRSRTIVVIDSPNFQESAWCRKELWVAEALTRHGLAEMRSLSGVDQITEILATERNDGRLRTSGAVTLTSASGLTGDADDQNDRTSWVCNRILRDIDYWARTPNLHSAREKGLPVGGVQSMIDWLHTERGYDSTNLSILQSEVVTRIDTMFNEVSLDVHTWMAAQHSTAESSLSDTADLWATATQLAAAALSLRIRSYSKMETRRYVVALNRITYELLDLLKQDEEDMRFRLPSYLKLAAGAVALDLAAENRSAVLQLGLGSIMGNKALLQDGLILLDVRNPGTERDFLLRLALLIVANDIGSVGVLQDGNDPVHNNRVDGICLEILPCVTLYPSMEAIFPALVN